MASEHSIAFAKFSCLTLHIAPIIYFHSPLSKIKIKKRRFQEYLKLVHIYENFADDMPIQGKELSVL